MCWLLCLFRHVAVLVSNLLCLISSIGIRTWLGLIPLRNAREDVIVIETDSLYICVRVSFELMQHMCEKIFVE